MKLFTGITEGKVYACTVGDYVGQLLIFIEKTDTEYGFLTIPTMENKWIPKDVFDSGLKNGIVEYVEKLPRYVRKTSKAQFTENRNTRKV